MEPDELKSLTVPEVRVTAPVRVMLPEPLPVTSISPPAPVETLALMDTAELLPLANRITVAVPLTFIAPFTVNVPPELTLIELVVPEMAPSVVVLDAPRVVISKDLAPRVIVCPEEVKAPPLYNCRL